MKRLGLVLLVFSELALARAPAGVIELVKGDVLILDAKSLVVADPKGTRGRSTQKGQPFFVGETVQTREGARVKLKFTEGGNEVVLGNSTSLLIERAGGADTASTGTSLNLARGEVRSSVNKKYSGQGGDVFEVKTANAVAGVRGTIFVARFDSKTFKSDFATERGAVFVKSMGGSGVMVNAGMFTSAANANVVPPAPIQSNPELSQAVQALGASGDGAFVPPKAKDSQASADPAVRDEKRGDQAARGPNQKNEDQQKSAPLTREPVKEEQVAQGQAGGPSRGPASVNQRSDSANNQPRIMGEDPANRGPRPEQFQSRMSQEMGRVMDNARNIMDKNINETRNVNNMSGRVVIKIE